jgi:phage major head subunit gpT-like protein
MSGMPLNTNSLSKLLWPGINKIWGENYPDYKPEWSEIFEKYTSDRNWEEDVGMSGFGLLSVKNEGSPIVYDTMKQGYTTKYVHTVVGGGFMITREAVEDNLYTIQANKKAKALARAEHQTRETFGANVLNRAFNSSYVFGDGVALCSTSHPNVSGGTFANRLATDANISEAVLEDMSINIWALTDDRGLKAALTPRKIIVPPALAFETDRILKTEGRVGTDLNDRNTIKSMGVFPEGYFVSHYLTSTTAFFVLTNVGDGLKYFERRAAEFKADNDFDTDNAKFKVTARYVFGATDPRCIYGTTGV